jgi:TBC1 domain family member 10
MMPQTWTFLLLQLLRGTTSRPDDSESTGQGRYMGMGMDTTQHSPNLPSLLQIPNHTTLSTPLSPNPSVSSSPSGNPPLSPFNSFPLPPQQAPHLRPGMSGFVAVQHTSTAGANNKRASLFLPHPNAPKPSNSCSGPMYGQQQQQQRPQPPPSQRPTTSLSLNNNITGGSSTIRVLQQAVAARFAPNGQMRRTTIYGRCDSDLMSADRPVLIAFSLDPPPATPLLLDRMDPSR